MTLDKTCKISIHMKNTISFAEGGQTFPTFELFQFALATLKLKHERSLNKKHSVYKQHPSVLQKNISIASDYSPLVFNCAFLALNFHNKYIKITNIPGSSSS